MKNVLLLAFSAFASIASATITVGSAAPDFSLADTTGKTHSLSEFKGKYVVLEWVNPDCPFVKKHYESGNMPSLQHLYTGKGVIWLTIDSSAPGHQGNYAPPDLARWAKEKGAAPSAILLDGDGRVGRQYSAKTTPHMFVISPDGKLLYEGAIDSIASPDKADIQKATNYVKAALDEALAGQQISTSSTKSYGCGIKY